MGTRSLSSIKLDGIYYTQYTQFDGYLSGRGTDFLKFVAKAVPYITYQRNTPEYSDRATMNAMAIVRGYLWMESLESGHGWRGEDENGHNWSYQEDAKLDISKLAGGVEYIRLLDLDAGSLTFYGDTLEAVIFSVKLKDFIYLDYDGQEIFYKLMDYIDQQRWSDYETPLNVDLTIKTGKRVPIEFGWAKAGETRNYQTITFNGKVVYASRFAPAATKTKAEKNSKALFEKKEEVEV
jgi:hypothetical protein